MAISTQGVTLMKKDGNTYKKLVDIKSFPDLGAAPQTIETTTLSDSVQTFIKGVDTNSELEFTANYSANEFDDLIALADDEEDYALFFGADGSSGKFGWSGQLSAWVVGGGVNGVVETKIVIVPTSAITLIA